MEAHRNPRIAVLIPAHNEENNLALSLPDAVRQVGSEDVYVVDDNSSDGTVRTALEYTPNVYSVVRGGKGAAVMAGIDHLGLLDRYEGILVLDADSRLRRTSIARYEEKIKEGVAAVIGHLKGLKVQRGPIRSEEHTAELQSRPNFVFRLLLEK